MSVTEAQKRADQLKSDIARLEGDNDHLKSEVKRLTETVEALRRNDHGQRALLVYRDGRVKNQTLPIEPDSSHPGYRPVRQITVGEMYRLRPWTDPGTLLSPTSRTFEIAYNQANDAKLVVYVER